MDQNEKDLEIIKQLHYGNHLNNDELERAFYLLSVLKIELNSRIN